MHRAVFPRRRPPACLHRSQREAHLAPCTSTKPSPPAQCTSQAEAKRARGSARVSVCRWVGVVVDTGVRVFCQFWKQNTRCVAPASGTAGGQGCVGLDHHGGPWPGVARGHARRPCAGRGGPGLGALCARSPPAAAAVCQAGQVGGAGRACMLWPPAYARALAPPGAPCTCQAWQMVGRAGRTCIVLPTCVLRATPRQLLRHLGPHHSIMIHGLWSFGSQHGVCAQCVRG